MNHTHDFPIWPFDDAINTAAFTTRRVIEQGLPVLLVSHDLDGEWQFLCGTTTETADCRIVCMGCAYERDQTIADVADLPIGWMAEREVVGSPWERFPRAADDEPA